MGLLPHKLDVGGGADMGRNEPLFINAILAKRTRSESLSLLIFSVEVKGSFLDALAVILTLVGLEAGIYACQGVAIFSLVGNVAAGFRKNFSSISKLKLMY